MFNRREFLGITAGAGATLALTPELLRALQQSGGKLIQRAIPSSGEMLPVIGLTFANHAACADRAALKEVLKTFVDNGGREFDAMHGGPPSQPFHATLANELGVQNKLFWATRGAPPGGGSPLPPGPAAVTAYIATLLAEIKVPRIDLAMVTANDPTHLAALKEEKKAGRVRYIGVQTGLAPGSPQLESIMRSEPIDFIGVNYAIGVRGAEQTILPLAQERKIAVMAFYPFGGADTPCPGESGPPPSTYRSLFTRVSTRPLPEWAAEFDANTWAQFFLKYVISHPAITVARVGTTKAHHMLDDIGGGVGRLPNEATRKRMAEFIDALPYPVPAAMLDRFVGEYQAASGLTASFRRDGETLFVKSGTKPEVALIGRSTTRLVDPQGSVYEFQLAGQGPAIRATSVILEQGSQKITLERK